MASLLSRLGTLVALTSGLALACSSSLVDEPGTTTSEPEGHTGTVGLSLVPVSGITVSSVHFVVTKAGATISEGDLPTPGSADQLSFGLPVPVGTGYTLSLSGVSIETTDDVTCTGSYGPFDVLPNSGTAFSMRLICVNTANGGVISTVDVETDDCPRLVVDYAVAIPSLATLPDGTIKVVALAHDLDNPAAPISYSWSIASSNVGDFTPATGASTTFNCNDVGDHVAIRVTASNGECDTSLETFVTCIPGDGCGNGVVQPEFGETCDYAAGPGHPADPSCPSDCTKVCGDGVVEGNEQCDFVPANPVCCNNCQLLVSTCGDGFIGCLEACDGNVFPPGTPTGSTCNNSCSSIIPPPMPSCGDNVVAATEECDVGGSGSPLCSPQCEAVGTQACLECEEAGDCFEFFDNCSAFTGANKTLCYDVMQCIQDSNCDDGTRTLASCYCGTIPSQSCSSAPLTGPGSPNGPCKDLIIQGLQPVFTSQQVLGLLTATGRPAGGAMARLNCQKVANSGVCFDVCGFTQGGSAFP